MLNQTLGKLLQTLCKFILRICRNAENKVQLCLLRYHKINVYRFFYFFTKYEQTIYEAQRNGLYLEWQKKILCSSVHTITEIKW